MPPLMLQSLRPGAEAEAEAEAGAEAEAEAEGILHEHVWRNIHNGFALFVLSLIVFASQLSAAAPFLDTTCLHALRNAFAKPFATVCARWVRITLLTLTV